MKLEQLREVANKGFNDPKLINIMSMHFEVFIDLLEAAKKTFKHAYDDQEFSEELGVAISNVENI